MLNYDTPVITRRATDCASLILDRVRPPFRLPDRFQMLFYGDGRPITIVNHWLSDMARARMVGGRRWSNTQSSYADDAAQGTIILFSLGKTWDDLSFKLITRMAAALLVGYSVWTRRKRHKKTITRRVGTFLRIARHALKHGYPMDAIPHEGMSAKEVLDLAVSGLHDMGSEPAKVTQPTQRGLKVNPILRCGSILEKLGGDILSPESEQPASDRNTNYRDRLAAETSLYTGLRVDEVAHLTVTQILSLANGMHKNPTQKEFPLLIVHTKGSDPAPAMFPGQLIKGLVKYIEGEREHVVDAARKRRSARYVDPGTLFLNGTQANDRDVGQPLTEQSISRIFSRAVSRCGLFREETRFVLDREGSLVHDPETAEPLTENFLHPAHTFHDLRHTFAVVQYAIRSMKGEKNPLASVRALLRHKLSQTTADIYLDWYHLHERHLSEMLTAYLGDIANAAETAR